LSLLTAFVECSHFGSSSSCFSALPFSCVWHWRSNVVGLTLASRSSQSLVQKGQYIVWRRPILSELNFSEDYSGGKVLVHVLMDSSNGWESDNRIRKEMYTLALLSPSETWHGTGSGCEQPQSLMVSSKCVTFPCVVSVSHSCSLFPYVAREQTPHPSIVHVAIFKS
jgi:hypothetical protein